VGCAEKEKPPFERGGKKGAKKTLGGGGQKGKRNKKTKPKVKKKKGKRPHPTKKNAGK